MFPQDIETLATRVLEAARARGLRVGAAESCTGGLVMAALTSIAGSSDAVEAGFVTYSNIAKENLLGVSRELLAEHGAVSEHVARAMAEGAVDKLGVGVAVSVTGVAGPGGGSADKPVGLVHFATSAPDGGTIHRAERFGDIGRAEVRAASVRTALTMLLERLTA